MDEYKTIWAILFLIAIILPPQKTMGAKGFLNDCDIYIEKPVKRLSPPKLIQIRYKISNAPINIITYLIFLNDFALWVMLIVMLPCVLFLKGKLLDTAFILYVIVYVLINLPIGIVRTVCTIKIAKRQKVKLQTEQYVAMRSLAEKINREFEIKKELREFDREYKKYETSIKPFLKEIERCLSKRKGVKYISYANLKYVIDRIFPKYEKMLYYSVSNGEYRSKLLSVYLTENDKILIQIQIKKD